MPPKIYVDCVSQAEGIPTSRSIRRWVRGALPPEHTAATLCVRIVDEEEARTLNARYRRRAYASNVLSFRADIPPELGLAVLGDIVICAPVVLREAHEQGKPSRAHWAHMLVHGTLHLLGFDHQRVHDATHMESLELEILATLKFPDPYACNGKHN